uniref:Uncharacterized protein n=1 Tax=Anguilla anguilla TaxID=7936 RepID=A0A0E9WC01_ANGAN
MNDGVNGEFLLNLVILFHSAVLVRRLVVV